MQNVSYYFFAWEYEPNLWDPILKICLEEGKRIFRLLTRIHGLLLRSTQREALFFIKKHRTPFRKTGRESAFLNQVECLLVYAANCFGIAPDNFCPALFGQHPAFSLQSTCAGASGG